MDVVGDDVAEFGAGEVGLVAGQINFRELDFGAGVGVVFGDLFPDGEGGVGLAQGGVGFGQGHFGVAVFVLGFFFDDAFEQREGFGGAFAAQEGLAEVGAGVDVVWVAFHGGTITGFGFVEFAALKIDVAELGVVVGFIEVMDLRLELFNAAAVNGAGQFKAAGGQGAAAIDHEVIKCGAYGGADEDEHGPDPIAAADGIDEHPDLEDGGGEPEDGGDAPEVAHEQIQDGGGHSGERVMFKVQSSRFKVGRGIGDCRLPVADCRLGEVQN